MLIKGRFYFLRFLRFLLVKIILFLRFTNRKNSSKNEIPNNNNICKQQQSFPESCMMRCYQYYVVCGIFDVGMLTRSTCKAKSPQFQFVSCQWGRIVQNRKEWWCITPLSKHQESLSSNSETTLTKYGYGMSRTQKEQPRVQNKTK